ncbi:MAG: hypothetical protein R3B72_43490 [Polyangiaceae bacterium]
MRLSRPTGLLLTALATLVVASAACGNGDGDGAGGGGLSGQTGQSCVVADDCFATVADRDQIPGAFQCLDRVEGGYCTHECTSDADCCSIEGECPNQAHQVCGPFESTGLMLCFISCENTDVGDMDPDAYCDSYARDFICRSTGGGSANRKVCVPGGGNPCGLADDCNADFPYCCEDSLGDRRCYDATGAAGRTCVNPPP